MARFDVNNAVRDSDFNLPREGYFGSDHLLKLNIPRELVIEVADPLFDLSAFIFPLLVLCKCRKVLLSSHLVVVRTSTP
jgi:hypothetical protein